MKMILWDEQNKFACDEFGEIPLTSKPTLSFNYDELRYVQNGEMWYTLNGSQTPLLSTIITEIVNEISRLRKNYGVKVLAADKDGNFIGKVCQNDDRIGYIVPFSPPTLDKWKWIDGNWNRIWNVDDNGNLNPDGCHEVLIEPLESSYCKFDFNNNVWVDETPFSDLQKMTSIDIVTALITSLAKSHPEDAKNFFVTLANEAITKAIGTSEQRKDDLKASIEIILGEVFDYSDNSDDLKIIRESMDIWL